MDNWETEGNKSLVATTYSSNTRSKTSSGLSGGAIAGIVVSCVVVVAIVGVLIALLGHLTKTHNLMILLDSRKIMVYNNCIQWKS